MHISFYTHSYSLYRLNALAALGILSLLLEQATFADDLHLLEALEHDTVSLPGRLNLEEFVHALKWNTLGLRNEEVDKEDGQDHQAGEEEVHSVAHGQEHLRGEA